VGVFGAGQYGPLDGEDAEDAKDADEDAEEGVDMTEDEEDIADSFDEELNRKIESGDSREWACSSTIFPLSSFPTIYFHT
jgi:hypothetical protein